MTYPIAALVALGIASPLLTIGVWFWLAIAIYAFVAFVVGTVVGRDDRP